MGIGATAGVAAVGGIALSAQASSDPASPASDALVFDPDGYTRLTTTITDADGTDHAVTYHFWKAITYVADPVDKTYQSLNVSVPVEIDGKTVDASGAPVLFANSVGGYMPSSVAKDSDTSLTVSANLAAAAADLGDDVNHLYYWDQGHGANTDPGDFVKWIAEVTGYRGGKNG